MTILPKVVSQEEWLVSRKELLIKEKETTRAQDALNAMRRKLPMVEISKEYTFEGPNGKVSLLDLFESRRQLVIHHFMFDPSWDKGCLSCTFFENDGVHLPYLHAKDTSYAVVSRAPHSKIKKYKQQMDWSIPWYSSFGGDFNYDFLATMDESVTPVQYNYKNKAEHERAGMPWYTIGEQPGVSVFLRDNNRIFHTYSTYARGVELLVSTPNFLDLTPLGRQEG